MMKRKAGRPPTAEGGPAKDRILAAVRDVMQQGNDFNRTTIAVLADVTPALITYHFPTRWLMTQAAIKPMIELGIQQMRQVIQREGSQLDGLKTLVALFLRFNTENGNALERYVEEVIRNNRMREIDELLAVQAELRAFVGSLLNLGAADVTDARLAQQALWGMCRHISRSATTPTQGSQTEDGQARFAREVDFIVDLIVQRFELRQ